MQQGRTNNDTEVGGLGQESGSSVADRSKDNSFLTQGFGSIQKRKVHLEVQYFNTEQAAGL